MNIGERGCRVLVVSKTAEMTVFLKEALPAGRTKDTTWVQTAGEAKRLLLGASYDVVVINAPLEDDYGMMTAIDIQEQHDCGVLLLVKREMYVQVAYKAEAWGIFTLPKPVSAQAFYSAFCFLLTAQMRLQKMTNQMTRLKLRIEEIQMIDRAKWILAEKQKMTEAQAHRYIEKQAMDKCVKRTKIAENIIKMYES